MVPLLLKGGREAFGESKQFVRLSIRLRTLIGADRRVKRPGKFGCHFSPISFSLLSNENKWRARLIRGFHHYGCICSLHFALTSKSHAQTSGCRDCLSIDWECLNQFGRNCSHTFLNVSMRYYGWAPQNWMIFLARFWAFVSGRIVNLSHFSPTWTGRSKPYR